MNITSQEEEEECSYRAESSSEYIIDTGYKYFEDTSEPGELVSPAGEDHSDKDPFNPKCRIPLPDGYGTYCLLDSTTFIRRRNERERTRVRNVNEGFEKLRGHLPLMANQRDKRLSKVETLRLAISYIKHLQQL